MTNSQYEIRLAQKRRMQIRGAMVIMGTTSMELATAVGRSYSTLKNWLAIHSCAVLPTWLPKAIAELERKGIKFTDKGLDFL